MFEYFDFCYVTPKLTFLFDVFSLSLLRVFHKASSTSLVKPSIAKSVRPPACPNVLICVGNVCVHLSMY